MRQQLRVVQERHRSRNTPVTLSRVMKETRGVAVLSDGEGRNSDYVPRAREHVLFSFVHAAGRNGASRADSYKTVARSPGQHHDRMTGHDTVHDW